MSPEQINRAIAEHCGWEWYTSNIIPKSRFLRNKNYKPVCGIVRTNDATLPVSQSYQLHPDFYHDLNAMQEAERTLTHDQWRIFLGFLMNNRVIPKFASMEDFHEAWNSTSLQRAQAFVKTIGKWNDE